MSAATLLHESTLPHFQPSFTNLLPLAVCFLMAIGGARLASSAPARGFVGVNVGSWDSRMDTPAVTALLRSAGVTALRWPGGSTADSFDWTARSASSTMQFAQLAASLNAVATITTNYGTGTPQMAAAFAAYCNALPSSKAVIGRDAAGRDWRTAGYWASVRAASPLRREDGLNHLRAAHPAPFGFRNWEIGNECYGAWEIDHHRPAHDPVVYALFAADAIRLMRTVDPALRVGVVATDQSDADSRQESIRNPRSGRIESGWNAIVFSTLSKRGITPDFISVHHYAQSPGTESDAALLRDPAQWPTMIARLRAQLGDYYARGAKHIGIACTECNSVSFNPGPQTTGEANARYYAQVAPVAQSLGVESLIWWDLHNGPSFSGTNTRSPLNLYPYGDYGIVGWGDRLNKPYPVYYAIRHFATGR